MTVSLRYELKVVERGWEARSVVRATGEVVERRLVEGTGKASRRRAERVCQAMRALDLGLIHGVRP